MTKEYCDWVQTNTGIKVRRTGRKIGKHLVISYTDKYAINRPEKERKLQIFGILSGRPVTELKFQDNDAGMNAAVAFAEWLDEVYSGYWDLWEVYKDWNIIQISQWTVPDGLQIHLTLSYLEQLQAQKERSGATPDTITNVEMQKAWQAAYAELPKLTRFMRPR